MLNQSKTCHQAEIDSACELIDFWRLNAHFAQQIYQDIQPPISPEGIQNSCEEEHWRALFLPLLRLILRVLLAIFPPLRHSWEIRPYGSQAETVT